MSEIQSALRCEPRISADPAVSLHRETTAKSAALVYVIILNWNGWSDTIECLESLFRSDHQRFRVIVCDNDSSDGSLSMIRAWAEGCLSPLASPHGALRSLVLPTISKPIRYVEYDRAAAESGGAANDSAPLVLIRTGANLGFAGGCNVGLRHALARGDGEFVWLLNNDTVVQPSALSALVRWLATQASAGLCGSVVRYYDEPDTVQLVGGARYYRWLGLSRLVRRGARDGDQVWHDRGVRRLSFVSGASMLVRTSFLVDIGLMNEAYFLYFEEIDWAVRAKGRYGLTYASDSIVYHKAGRSIGSNHKGAARSLTSEYYLRRNALRFTMRYFPACLPTVYLTQLVLLLNALRLGRWDAARMMGRLLATGR